jgi:hypothetical protein
MGENSPNLVTLQTNETGGGVGAALWGKVADGIKFF